MNCAASGMQNSTALSKLLRGLLLVSLPFVVGIALLVLDRLRWIDLDPRFGPRVPLILGLLLYWLVAAGLLILVLQRRAVRAFVRARKAPLAAAVVSGIAALGAAEFALRALGLAPDPRGFQHLPSRTLHHVNPPNLAVRDGTGSFVRTNADGLRSDYSRERFLAYRERIAVLGDSFTFGLGVDGDDTACAVLERTLRKRLGRDDVAVLNTGVISYSPLLECLAFREVVRGYQPTLTILLLDGNDIGDDLKYARQVLSADPERPVFDPPEAEDSLALTRIAQPVLAKLKAPFDVLKRFFPGLRSRRYYEFELEIGGVLETNRWFILRHPLKLTRPYFDATFGHIRDVARDARAAGSEFLLAVAPRYFHWSDKECPDDWAGGAHQYDEPFEFAYLEFFEAQAAQADFPIVSLLPAFRASTVFPLVFRHDPHWNENGHELVGETLAAMLIERGLVDEKADLGRGQ